MKNLIILGAGGFGRELFSWIEDVQGYGSDWRFAGFLDDNPAALKNYQYEASIIGSIKDYQPKDDDVFALGIAAPTPKKLEIAEDYEKRGGQFLSLIHPTVIVGKNVTMGRGCIICPQVVFTCDIQVGNYVMVNACSAIGHDAVLGDGCTLYSFVNINGFVTLGRGVEVGSHGSVLPKVSVGDFAKIGAGSVVIKNVQEKITVVGVPARKILGH